MHFSKILLENKYNVQILLVYLLTLHFQFYSKLLIYSILIVFSNPMIIEPFIELHKLTNLLCDSQDLNLIYVLDIQNSKFSILAELADLRIPN